jgi:hypothetical protein
MRDAAALPRFIANRPRNRRLAKRSLATGDCHTRKDRVNEFSCFRPENRVAATNGTSCAITIHLEKEHRR